MFLVKLIYTTPQAFGIVENSKKTGGVYSWQAVEILLRRQDTALK